MAKRAKKNAQKGKRVPVSSLKPVPQAHDNRLTAKVVKEDGLPVEMDKDKEKDRRVCVHLGNAVDQSTVSQVIESADSIACQDCREGALDRRAGKGKGKHGKKKAGPDSKSLSKATWICLQCGHFSCGGVGMPNNPQSHSVRHVKLTRHPLVIQLENPNLRWCFSCNMFITVDKLVEDNGELKDAFSDIVKLFKKQPSKGNSLDVEDVWFGSGSVIGDSKSEIKGVNGSDVHTVRGLVNLGNTCFFNSVMQNLLAMGDLREYLLKFDGSMGPLTSALKKIFLEARADACHKNVINPRSVFGCVCAKAPQFRGYQQQDSHELLRCLLDGISSEELSAKRSDRSSSENGGHGRASPTFIDAIFGGQLSSTVCCAECGHSSVVYEPFLDLSLPLPSKKPPVKKFQPVSRARKTKLPPKRVSRTRPKINRDGALLPSASSCNLSTSSADSQAQQLRIGCNPLTSTESCSEMKEATASSSTADLVEPGDTVESLKCNDSSEQTNACTLVTQATELEGDGMAPKQSGAQEDDCFTWLDILDSVPLLDDPDLTTATSEIPVGQDLGSKDVDNDSALNTTKSSCEISLQPEGPSPESELTFDDRLDERPLQVQENEVLLLTYKEENSGTVGGRETDVEISLPTADGTEDSLELGDLGDLFNEPEVAVTSSFQANGTGNCSESDADEVDDTNSPVSIESCLGHFIRPELLSGEHAWHCENCSKLAGGEKRKSRKNKQNTASAGQIMLSNDECLSFEALQNSHCSPDCSTSIVATHSNGSSDPDMNLDKLEVCQTNGTCPPLGQGKEECFVEDNLHSHPLSASAGTESMEEATLGDNSFESHNMLGDHVTRDKLSGPCDEQESGKDEEEEVESSKTIRVMRDATKRILINKPPQILTIHLKRFGQDARGRLSKLSGHVGFKEIINLEPYLDRRCIDREHCIYHLIGVVVHSGTMKGGHYIAYVKGGDRCKGRVEEDIRQGRSVWYYVSDARVREASLEEVLSSEAYLLFYEKLRP